MINTDEFVKRLETIFDYYGLSASLFADKINVQRSSISHLLSGRNKPSLDFILKVIDSFPEVELLWLLNGKGSFPKSEFITIEKKIDTTPISKNENIDNFVEQNLFGENNYKIQNEKTSLDENNLENFSNNEVLTSIQKLENNLKIDRIVIFYNNGTFKNYIP